LSCCAACRPPLTACELPAGNAAEPPACDATSTCPSITIFYRPRFKRFFGVSCIVHQAVFSSDGRYLATCSSDQSVRVWNTATWKEEYSLRGSTAPVRKVAFHPSGRRLASLAMSPVPVGAVDDGQIRIWQVPGEQDRSRFTGQTLTTFAHVLSPNGSCFAVADAAMRGDRHIGIYDAISGLERVRCLGHAGIAVSLAFSPDGRLLASGGGLDQKVGAGQVFLWDVATGRRVRALDEHPSQVGCVRFFPDSRRLLTVDVQATVRIWEASTAKRLASWNLPIPGPKPIQVDHVVISPDGRLLALPRFLDGKHALLLLDAETGQQVRSIPCGAPEPNVRSFAAAFSSDGRRLAFTRDMIRIADTETGELLLSFGGHQPVTSLSFSPDGSRLASASWSTMTPGRVQLWDTKTGQELLTFKCGDPGAPSLAFTENGNKLAALFWWANTAAVVFFHAEPPSEEEVTRRDAVELVKTMFAKHSLRAETLDALRHDATLHAALRAAALDLADYYPEDARRLNNESWRIVRVPGGKAENYRRAVRLAAQACRLAGEDGNYVNTLGVAQYRAGDLQAARDTLLRSQRLNAARFKTPLPADPAFPDLPADLAFLAMVRHRLGDTAQAQTDLARLRQTVATPAWTGDAEAQAFQREAEELLNGSIGKKEPP
jgi:WD40 repeat protein